MYRSMLVPVDGSSFSELALGLASDLARRSGATLHLALVHEPLPAPGLADLDPAFEEEIRNRQRAYLEELKERLAADGLTVETILLEGRAASELRDFTVERGIELIIMTTHAHSGLTRSWLGSVADRLVRTAPVPILLLRPVEEGGVLGLPEEGIRQILVPLDGSRLAEAVLPHVTRLGDLLGASYVLARVVPPRYRVRSPYLPHAVELDHEHTQQQIKEAEQYLGEIAERLRADAARQVESRAREEGIVADRILRIADEEDVDLIAIATHGRGGILRAVLGSVADKVLRGAGVPVLVFHPGNE